MTRVQFYTILPQSVLNHASRDLLKAVCLLKLNT